MTEEIQEDLVGSIFSVGYTWGRFFYTVRLISVAVSVALVFFDFY